MFSDQVGTGDHFGKNSFDLFQLHPGDISNDRHNQIGAGRKLAGMEAKDLSNQSSRPVSGHGRTHIPSYTYSQAGLRRLISCGKIKLEVLSLYPLARSQDPPKFLCLSYALQ